MPTYSGGTPQNGGGAAACRGENKKGLVRGGYGGDSSSVIRSNTTGQQKGKLQKGARERVAWRVEGTSKARGGDVRHGDE